MKGMKWLILGAVMLLAIGSVSAWWLIGKVEADWCYDTDGGFDWDTKGTMYYGLNGTNVTVSDYCLTNTSVAEHACGDDVGFPGYAGRVGENCSGMFNGTGHCEDGACVPN